MALILLMLILSYKRLCNLWHRYKNTKIIDKKNLLYPDYISLFLIFTIVFFLRNKLTIFFVQTLEVQAFSIAVIVMVLFWLIASYSNKKHDRTETQNNTNKYSLLDEPIIYEAQDLFGRSEFIEGLYKEICGMQFEDSYVFGLYGRWGEGKTSAINLLLRKFKNNDEFLTINFDPWYFKNSEGILLAFYNELENVISKQYIIPDIRKTFKKYQSFMLAGLSKIGINLVYEKDSLKDIKAKIEDYIARIGKKILIVVDDIDRLDTDEMLFVFKMIRLSSNFKNTSFLLSMDHEVVVRKLSQHTDKVGPEFLEKIIQKIVVLPKIEQSSIDKFILFSDGAIPQDGDNLKTDIRLSWIDKIFYDLLMKGLITREEIEKFDEHVSYIYRTNLSKKFKTLRVAKRYIGSLSASLPPVANEVNLQDFILLEFIKVFYVNIYNDIYENWWFYVDRRHQDDGLLNPWGLIASRDEQKKNQIKDAHVKSLLEKNIDNGIEIEMVTKILSELFPRNASVSHARQEKRIHSTSFNKYFLLKVPVDEIPDVYFETVIDIWNKENNSEKNIENFLWALQKEGKLKEFLEKLDWLHLDRINNETGGNLINFIYKNIERFSIEGTDNLWNSEYDKAKYLMLNLINEKIDPKKIQKTIENIIKNTPSLPFAVHVTMSCSKERNSDGIENIQNNLNLESIKATASDRLKDHFIKNSHNIFNDFPAERDWCFILYQWLTNWETFDKKDKNQINKYILTLISNSKKNLIQFLKGQRGRSTSRGISFNLKEMARIYNVDELKKVAEKACKQKGLKKEKREILTKFIDAFKQTT